MFTHMCIVVLLRCDFISQVTYHGVEMWLHFPSVRKGSLHLIWSNVILSNDHIDTYTGKLAYIVAKFQIILWLLFVISQMGIIFYNFWNIHTKVHNYLGNTKAFKLVFCYRILKVGVELDY